MTRGILPFPVLLSLVLLLLTGSASGGLPRGVTLNAGDQVTSAVLPAGDEDTYVFDALAGGRLTVRLTVEKGSALVPSLSVLGPDGGSIDLAPYVAAGKGRLTLKKLPIASTGPHAIVVGGDGESTGAYVLKTKAKWPRKLRWKEVPLGARETVDFTIPGFDGMPISVKVRDRGRVGFSVGSLIDPDGEPHSTGALVTKGHVVKGTLILTGRLGDYRLQAMGAGEATVLDVTVKTKVPKVAKRKLVITPFEPVITGLTPDTGWEGDQIAISGENFAPSDVAVFFGDLPSPEVIEAAADDVRARVPAGEGEVKILLVNPDGQWAVSEATFSFVAAPPLVTRVTPTVGPDTGGTSVTVDGMDLGYVEVVRLGGEEVSGGPNVISDRKFTFRTDPHEAGTVDLELIDRWGKVKTIRDAFTFFGRPEIDRVSPRSGSTKGGTHVTVTGAWFRPDDAVFLDGAAVVGFTYLGPTSFRFQTRAHPLGLVDLLVRDPWGRTTVLRGAFEFSTASLDDITDDSVPANEGRAIYGGRAVAVEDVDGDGDLDLAFGRPGDGGSGPFVTLLVNDGTGKFTGGTMPETTTWGDHWEAADLAAGDLDGDGDEDLVLTCEKRFAATTTYTYFVGKVPHEAHGRLFPSTRVLINDGKGGFALKKDAFPSLVTKGTDLLMGTALSLGDLDGDEDLDLVLTSSKSVGESTYVAKVLASNVHRYFSVVYLDDRPATRVLLNDGKANFKDVTGSAVPELESGDMFAGDDVAIGDVDGDGEPDVVVTGEGSSLRDSRQPEYVQGSRTRVLLNDGSAYLTNATAKLMPPVLSGDDWGGRGITIGDLDGDKRRDDLIVTTTRKLSSEAESATFHPSTRVFTGSDRGFTNATADWLPYIRSDGQGDIHRGVAALMVNLAADLKPSIFLVNAAPVSAWDPESGEFDRQVSSLRWFRLSGEMPLVNVSERQLPDPADREDWYFGHALGFGDLDGDGSLELVVTTDHEDLMKESKRPTRILTVR